MKHPLSRLILFWPVYYVGHPIRKFGRWLEGFGEGIVERALDRLWREP